MLSLLGILLCICAHAQDDTTNTPVVSGKFVEQAAGRMEKLQTQLHNKSAKILQSFQREENKLKRKLARKDSAAAAAIFGDAANAYAKLQTTLASAGQPQQYIPSLDTLTASFKLLEKNPQLLADTKDGAARVQAALVKATGLEEEFKKAEGIKHFLKERKDYLKQQLDQIGMAKQLSTLNKHGYYYTEQLNEYKALLKDHAKAERKALELLSKTQLFKDFMRKHSVLASLFRLPGSTDDPSTQASLAGLQTRVQVNGLVQQQLATGGANAQAQFSQNMQDAQNQLNKLKNKLNQLGSSGGEWDMPEGFKPNSQRTKTFLQRIELGINIQSQKSNQFFPVTSDFALTAGYKLGDNSNIGIGAGYKMGWGKNFSNIKLTHEGVSLRSFVDIRLKKSFWLTGGYELHYRSSFHRIQELQERNAWQESGLIGISKVIDQRSKLLKKTKVQLLWDLLSYRQVPKPAAVQFRIGYSF